MAEELITYGMVRAKGYLVSGTKQDSEYVIKQDFEIGGSIGPIPTANLSEYQSNELIENSSIPFSPYFHINPNKSGKVYMSNATIKALSSPSNLVSRMVSIGLNKVNLPVTVGTPTGGTASLSIGDTIYFYGDPAGGFLVNTPLGSYTIADKGVATITFPSEGGGGIDPEPTNSMTINFSGVASGYTYAFVIGTGLLTGDIPILLLYNGAITYNIPMTVYNSNTGRSQEVSSGTVSIYRKSKRIGSNWEFRMSFSVVKGSNISVNV